MRRSGLLALSSALAGIGAMYLFRLLNGDQSPSTPYNFIWEKVFVSAIVVFGFAFGFVEPRAPWRWPLVMGYVHYFSGFFIMKFWGQIPPFELLYIGLLSLPGVAAGYAGKWLGKKFRMQRPQSADVA